MSAGESRSYAYEASDGHGGSDTATLRVRVVRPNQSPTARDDVNEVQFGRDESGRFVDLGSYAPSTENDEDPDGDELSITGTGAPSGQSWLAAGAELFYRYFLSDGHGGTAEARVVVRGWPAPNEDPVTQDDEYTVLPYGTTNNLGSVKDNDRDPEGDPLSVRAGTISTTGGGSVSMSADGTFSYAPSPGELNRQFSDSFEYVLEDDRGGTAAGRVTLTTPPLPSVTIAAVDADAYEGIANTSYYPVAGRFTVTRSGDQTDALTVTYSIGGSATNYYDYRLLSRTVVIEAGRATADVVIDPVSDGLDEGDETVELVISESEAYQRGAECQATVVIHDPPSLTAPADQTHREGSRPTLQLTAQNLRGGERYVVTGLPSGLNVDGASGLISGKIAYDAYDQMPSGGYGITAYLQDAAGNVLSTVNFRWNVLNAAIGRLVGREFHPAVGDDPQGFTSNWQYAQGLTWSPIYVSPLNTVRLSVGGVDVPPDYADILWQATEQAHGDFTNPDEAEVELYAGVVIQVIAGIDLNLNGALDANEHTHSLSLHRINFDGVTFTSRRTSSYAPESTGFAIREDELFEVDGEFEFEVQAGPTSVMGDPSLIRAAVWDAASNSTLSDDNDPTFNYVTNVVSTYLRTRVYADANDNHRYDAGELYEDSERFTVMPRKEYSFGLWWSSALAADPSVRIEGWMDYGTRICLTRDDVDDWRAPVLFSLNTDSFMFTAGGTSGWGPWSHMTPDPVMTYDDALELFAAAPQWTIIAVGSMQGLQARGIAEGIDGFPWINEIIIDMSTARDETLAHEIGHLSGLAHEDAPSNDHIMRDGTLRNPGASKLTKQNAYEYAERLL